MENKVKKASWLKPKQLWIVIYAGILFFGATILVAGMTNTAFPIFGQLRNWDYSVLVMLSGVAMFVSAATGILFGQLALKIGFKKVMIGGLIGMAIVSVVMGLTTSMGLFIVAIFCANIFATAFQNVGVSSLVNTWFPRTKGIVLGWATMGIILSDILWSPNIPKPMLSIGPEKTFTIVGACYLVIAIVGIIFVKSTPEQANTYPDGDPTGIEDLQANLKALQEYKSPWTIGKLLKTSRTWQIIFGWGLLWMISICYVSQFVPRVMSLGYEMTTGTTIMTVGGFVALFGSWFFGFLDQKIGTKQATRLCGIWLLLMFILAMLHPISIAFIWISEVGIMASIGGVCNLIPSMIGTTWGRWDFAAANRLINPVTLVFPAAGIFLGGVFLNVGLGYLGMYIVCAVLALISIIIVSTTKTTFLGKE